MPVDNQIPWIIMFTTLGMYFASKLFDYSILPLYQQLYIAKPIMRYESQFTMAKDLQIEQILVLDIFYKYLLTPLSTFLDQAQTYYYKQTVPDQRATHGYVYVLNIPTIMKNKSMLYLYIRQLFDQDCTTAMTDCLNINLTVLNCFFKKYLVELKPGIDKVCCLGDYSVLFQMFS